MKTAFLLIIISNSFISESLFKSARTALSLNFLITECKTAIRSLIGLFCLNFNSGFSASGVCLISVGNAVIGRLRLGKISVPTIALMVVDLPAFIVPTTATTISKFSSFTDSPWRIFTFSRSVFLSNVSVFCILFKFFDFLSNSDTIDSSTRLESEIIPFSSSSFRLAIKRLIRRKPSSFNV